MRTNASRRESRPTLVELDPRAFGRHLDALMDVYAAAMNVPAFQLPGRRAIMNAHVINPAFRAIAVTVPAAPADRTLAGTGQGTTSPGTTGTRAGPANAAPVSTGPGPGTTSPGTTGTRAGPASAPVGTGTGQGETIVGFAYGFHGNRGQWWHDLVRSALTVTSGRRTAGVWLDDSFEVAEVHVRPEYQRRGIGRQMLSRLTGGLAERTAVLSTMDAETPARRLYHSLGFTDLLTGYQFAGVAETYAIMGAALPLLSGDAVRPPSPRC